jgi:uncharacterized phiE125 gp8 family phage protein
MMTATVITGPTIEPITLAELQATARIDTSDAAQDVLVDEIFIPAARDYIEWRTGRTFHEKTLELALDGFPCGEITLPGATPLIEIVSIKYKDSDGAESTLSASTYVIAVGNEKRLGRLTTAYGATWPSFTPYPLDPVKIRYKAGIAITSPLTEAPGAVKHAMCLLVAKMWEHREAVIISDRQSIAQLAVEFGLEAFIGYLQADYAF